MTKPRRNDGSLVDPLWTVDGLIIRAGYNSNRGDQYEHDHNNRIATYSFDCEFTEYGAPPVVQRPTDEERAQWIKSQQRLARIRRRRSPNIEIGPHPDDGLNPSRYEQSGRTERPRDTKRENERCGRHHRIKAERIAQRWHELAGTSSTMSPREAMIQEKSAYESANYHWEITLSD
ncbi:hypothetical protein QP922_09675 [Corynebacterium sp. MSK218]|uniref:hypothetical protein n=1 Tax=Corynebacterium sp. MSK218 TaxID=3050218 RepID=UPI0025515631|nr:hypothetical protein [Corynebacterium sp. MSK218]MDK8764087.1 hypothetical protein [Corynebacterium sp. MSK218]